MESGWTIEDNTFDTINMCMFIGGGRQNVVRRNTFRNCTVRPHGHRLDRFTLRLSGNLEQQSTVLFYSNIPSLLSYLILLNERTKRSAAGLLAALRLVKVGRFCARSPAPRPKGRDRRYAERGCGRARSAGAAA